MRHPLGNRSEPQGDKHTWESSSEAGPSFPLVAGVHSFPLLSHHLNLNKSNPSWPHPLASAFLPRGPEAPTTQAAWEGGVGGAGPALLPKGGLHTVNTCTQPRCCLRSLSHVLLQRAHVCNSSGMCPAITQARIMCVPTQHPRVHAPLSAQCTCTLRSRMLYRVSIREALVYNSHSCNTTPISQHRTHTDHVYTKSQSPSAHVSVNKHERAPSLACCTVLGMLSRWIL